MAMTTRSLSILVTLIAAFAAAPARADVTADVTAGFTSFVDSVGKGAAPAGTELFVPVNAGGEAVPKKLENLVAMIRSPKPAGVKVVVSPGGASAWLVADIPGWRDDTDSPKPHQDKIRASAMLVLDGTAWKVVASHWSIGRPNHKAEMCGDSGEDWPLPSSVPAEAADTVKDVIKAMTGDGSGTVSGGFWKLISTAKTSLVIGSAPKERFAGAKGQKVFKKWNVTVNFGDLDPTGTTMPVRAGVSADGQLMWMYTTVFGGQVVCTNYRALFILAKEKAGWRIVHQHYSEPVGLPDGM